MEVCLILLSGGVSRRRSCGLCCSARRISPVCTSRRKKREFRVQQCGSRGKMGGEIEMKNVLIAAAGLVLASSALAQSGSRVARSPRASAALPSAMSAPALRISPWLTSALAALATPTISSRTGGGSAFRAIPMKPPSTTPATGHTPATPLASSSAPPASML